MWLEPTLCAKHMRVYIQAHREEFIRADYPLLNNDEITELSDLGKVLLQ